MPTATPVVFVGLGPIGRSALGHALARPNLKVVGACDADPALAGKRLSELVSGAPSKVRVVAAVAELPKLARGTVAIVCTSSHVPQARATLEALLGRRLHVVSSCEELVYPQLRHPAFARRIDALARKRGVALLGTGVNPGFVLDLLPALLTAPCLSVAAVRARRVVDATTRRGPLQRKIGAGRTVEQFRAEVAAGKLGHVGLPESAHLLCAALSFGKPELTETIEPVVATAPIETPFVRVEAGQVAGIDHWLVAAAPRGRVELRLQMYLGAPEPRDEIDVDGEPPMKARLDGGTPGDLATVAALLNAAPRMGAVAPGLRTVIDGPFPLCRAR
jgi:4-hydroxy-tetrahydrodipicolinate reductase